MSVTILDEGHWFPDPETATADGLVAVGGDFSVPRLLLGYRSGLFPWTAAPVTWWSPDPRGVLELGRFHVSRSLGRVLRRAPYQVTFDQSFRAVIEGCATPGPGRRSTWITTDFLNAYTRLHQEGHAHSVECWRCGQLVGGVYGVAIGGFFAGESMFHRADNASKIALFHLVQLLRDRGFALFDLQMLTPATQQLGGTNIARAEYLTRLARAVALPVSWGIAK